MTQNEIVSHNLQLVMDALTEEEYQRFMVNYIRKGIILISLTRYFSAKKIVDLAFYWPRSKEGYAYWRDIYQRL